MQIHKTRIQFSQIYGKYEKRVYEITQKTLTLSFFKGETNLKKKHRLSKRMKKILELLSKPEHVDGLTREQIITAIEPDANIYVDGKVNRGSSDYGSWARTILKMVEIGEIIQVTTKTVYKKAT
jgi:hypothetical protein